MDFLQNAKDIKLSAHFSVKTANNYNFMDFFCCHHRPGKIRNLRYRVEDGIGIPENLANDTVSVYIKREP